MYARVPVAAVLVVSLGLPWSYTAHTERLSSGGGREKSLEEKAKDGAAQLKENGKQVLSDAKEAADKAKDKITK